jgi:hypothetical protein
VAVAVWMWQWQWLVGSGWVAVAGWQWSLNGGNRSIIERVRMDKVAVWLGGSVAVAVAGWQWQGWQGCYFVFRAMLFFYSIFLNYIFTLQNAIFPPIYLQFL